MNQNINLCEILKDCQDGTKFYSPLFGEVTFIGISDNVYDAFPIKTLDESGTKRTFTSEGRYDTFNKECLLFPSKDQRDWSKLKCPKQKKSKFDPKTLHPFDKVLFKNNNNKWDCALVSYIESDVICFLVNSGYVYYCIPYNEETKHLVGTSDEAPEYYRYWED